MTRHIFKHSAKVLGLLIMLTAVSACEQKSQPVKGFVLPHGDVEAGKLAFVYLGCHQCHNVTGVELPPFAGETEFDIGLGGKVAKVKSYGDLLTAVVHPDHEITRPHEVAASGKSGQPSPMPDTTAAMTVSQLIDVVEFLHAQYEQTAPQYQGYRYVY